MNRAQKDLIIKDLDKKYQIPGMQVVLNLKRERIEKGIEIRNARAYLRSLF